MIPRFSLSILSSMLVLGLGCDPAGSNDALPDGDSARSAAVDLVGGEAADAKRTTEDGASLWQVGVDKKNGAELEVLLFVDSGELFEVGDKNGPFDYDGGLEPLPDALTYDEARSIANDKVPGEQQAWEVKYTDKGYFYEFYQLEDSGDLWELKLWADSGDVISLKAKDSVD